MQLFNVYGVDKNDLSVEFSGRLIPLERLREHIQKLRPIDPGNEEDDLWLVLSNSGRAQVYFRGVRSGSVYYIYELQILSEPLFTEWKRLTRLLEVVMLDLSCLPTDTARAALYQRLGFEAVTKRIEVTVVGEFNYSPPEDIKALEELTLEQTEAVCYLMRPTLKDAGTREMLGELANGFVSAFVGLHGEKPFSLLLYKEFGKSIVTEQFCCQSFDPVTAANEYRKHFDMLLRLAKQRGKTINLGVPIEHELPNVEGIATRVVTHHYTFV